MNKKSASDAPESQTILLTREDMAREFQIDLQEVDRLRELGTFPPAFQLGENLRWSRETVQQWAQGQCATVSTPETRPAPNLLTPSDLTKKLGLNQDTVDKMIEEGRLPAPLVLGPRSRRWREDEIAQWIADGCRPVAS